jgi:hypothetical protein
MRSWWAKRQHYENVGPESREEWWLHAEEERASLLEMLPIISPKLNENVTSDTIHSPVANQATATGSSPNRAKASPPVDNDDLSSNEDDEDASSHGGSLESIDSQESSCGSSQNDASSQATELATNAVPTDYLLEHIEFLRQKTQPREVELVWALDQHDD